MRSIKHMIRATLLASGSLLVALGYPLSAFAEEMPTTVSDPPTISAPAEETTAPSAPPADQSDTSSAPATSQPSTEAPVAAPEPPKVTYTYDAATGRWNTNNWTYNPTSGKYEKAIQPVAEPVVVGPTGPSDTASLGIDSSTTNAIANALSSSALTGDASVLSNTTAGNATSGNASSVATIVNNVNSSMTSSANQQAAQFVSNVMGDVNGDIMLQPMLLKAMLEASAQKSASTSLQATTDTAITNDITLSAQSGDATVAKNTSAGNATSGSANTVANVLNIVNSMISANQSFVGTINIYGNLNGDILIAPDFIPNLLASNGGAGEGPKAVGTASIASDNNTSVVNNIALAAKTGEALVSGNTAAGNATSGEATTNTVIFNLTNHEVVASNSLLVFVNVLGKWVGVIIDAPTGATAAAIGDGVTKNSVAPNLVIDTVGTTSITNNLDLSSVSGNATVTRNTLAGNALSGNATASANVANIVGNNIGLSGWFGVLYINVFGSWVGSFGLNTSAGDAAPAPSASGNTNSAQPLRVIQFIPRVAKQSSPATVVLAGTTAPLTSQSQTVPQRDDSAVNGAMADENRFAASPVESSVAPIDGLNLPMVIGSLLLAGASLYGLHRLELSGSSAKHIAQ